MQYPNLGSAEHGVPKMSPIAKNRQVETGGVWGEDVGACFSLSVISTNAAEELFPAENAFLKETTTT